MAKQIKLNNGKFVIIDDEDFAYLSRFSWHFNVDEVCMTLTDRQGNQRHFEMHKFLIKHPPATRVYYKNRNPLDCRKNNLEAMSINYGVHKNRKAKTWGGRKTSSRFKGVSFSKSANKWMAYISGEKDRKYLGLFNSELEAAKEYNKVALEIFGENAYQNKVC